MIIQFNTDHNIDGGEKLTQPLSQLIHDDLDRYKDQLTRLEVYLSDQNGNKDGMEDKQCVIEARIEGRQPIAVKNAANTHEQAVDGALSKLKSSLSTIFGKMKDHHAG